MASEKRAQSPHYQHRERVRQRFLQSGLESFPDHNVLELLLFYAIPQGDTNVTAHNLIDRFGSLRGVLDAPVEELCRVKGMGMYSATFLSILPQLFLRYCDEASNDATVDDRETLFAYFRSLFFGEQHECVYLIGFDATGRKIGSTKIASGSPRSVSINDRQVTEASFRMNAVSVVLAHNHPGGAPAPSSEDIKITKSVAETLRRCSVRLLDHVIVAGSELFSMATHPRFRFIFET